MEADSGAVEGVNDRYYRREQRQQKHNLSLYETELDHRHDPSQRRDYSPSRDPSSTGPEFTNIYNPPPSDYHDGAATNGHHHAFNGVSPDDFYANYRSLPYESNPESLPMAPSSVPRPSLRSNGDGTTPKYPTVSSNRSLPRPNNIRSASSPVEKKSTPGLKPTGKPSVKDLKKRFDQNGAVSSIPRVPARSGAAPRTSTSKAGDGGNMYGAIRNGAREPTLNGTKERSQRPRYVAEDQVSNNPQSFASRVGKPRSSVGTNPNASRSMTQLSPDASPQPPPIPSPTTLPSQGLLFGEILPDHGETAALGFGIESLRPRGASESDTWAHQRSLSDPDIEPSSPSNWYRDVNADDDATQRELAATSRRHGRSLSDVATQRLPQPITRKGATRDPTSSSNNQASASKLPLSVQKLSTPGESTSPASTRSNSPSNARRQGAIGRASRATTPTARSKTPNSRAKTPTPSAGGRKGPSIGLPTPNSNTRLQAYIANPSPKLSPPLRSSRPRQPVSVATTASSRMRAVDKTKPIGNVRSRAPSRTPEPETRRRKISIGPIDFEQRREQIKLSYSKSLRESEALAARKRAAERRRQELEAAAKVRAEAEAFEAASPDTEFADEESGVITQSPLEEHPDIQIALDATYPTDIPISLEAATPTEATPTQQPESYMTPIQTSTSAFESPTLGLPGSFPAMSPQRNEDEPPLSAVTATTEGTEFDDEPQDRSPLPPDSPRDLPITIVKSPSPPPASRAEYQYPFGEEPESPIRPVTSQDTIQGYRDSVASSECDGSPVIPGAFTDDYDTVDLPGATLWQATVPILPPHEDSASDRGSFTTPFPRLEPDEDSDCHTELDDAPQVVQGFPYVHDDANMESSCNEDTDDQGKTDDCRSESYCDDQQSSHRLSSCASSEAGDGPNGSDQSYHQPTSNNHLVPPTYSNRISQHSQWTDLTVDSPNPSDLSRTPDLDGSESPTFGHVTIYGSRVVSRDSDTSSKDLEDEAAQTRPAYLSGGASYHQHDHLPTLDIGDQFTIPHISPIPEQPATFLPSPRHEPPPIPEPTKDSVVDSNRSSAYYENSQHGSRMTSGRGSEDFLSLMETPQTIDSNSAGTPDQYFGVPSQSTDVKVLVEDGDELSEKERKRLTQRRNVIKELVDTEAVFVRDMNIVEEIYKGTAEACPKLDDKTVKLIFRNTDEIINFHTSFLAQVKEAVAEVYVPKSGKSKSSTDGESEKAEISDPRDRTVLIGPLFNDNIEKMKAAHEGFLRSSDQAAKRLIQIQQDPTVKVWLNECNEVAKDLTAAWDLDSLLIKPMQRITKYPNLIITILQHTPQDHPDREALAAAKDTIENAIIEINKTKKNFELVGQIVGRKRKESDVKGGIARAFGKRVDKLQATGNRPPEDPEYAKFNEKFGDDYLRLQVVLRDIEFYTRQVATYVREFLQYLSSVELVMRLQPGSYPELESKWVQFNISIRDLEKIALEEHLSQVRKQVIEPFEHVIKAYGNPSLAMKKRQKRRLDFERMEQLKRMGKSIDSRTQEQVEQYEALNDTLKKELPQLSALTVKVGNICLGSFVDIQAKWYRIWMDKMKTVLGDCPDSPALVDIVTTFQQDFPYVDEQVRSIGILNPVARGRPSMSTFASADDSLSKKTRSPRPSDVDTLRSRTLSVNGDSAPSLPTPDFLRRNSGQLSLSPTGSRPVPSPHQYYYRDYYAGITASSTHSSAGVTPEVSGSSRSLVGTGAASTRPSTGRSFDSGGIPRQSTDSTTSQHRRDSNTTYSSYPAPAQDSRRFSGLFHSALPLPDGPEEGHRGSRASSRERAPTHDGYNILWLAASLFEFNIATTKTEAGYPYLVYQAGEIFDVIAEKGELWLARNQDDPVETVGWIWSKHFAKLADA